MATTEYQIPVLPLGGPQATIVRWLRRPGEPVAVGEPLLVVVNDRAEVALPAAAGGILEQTLAAEGAPAVVGAVVATMAAAPAREPTLETIADPAPDQPGATEPPRPRRISPVARKIAVAAGLDITLVASSGVSGRVVKADALAALALQESAPGPQEEDRLRIERGGFQSPISNLQSPTSLTPAPRHYVIAEADALTAIEADMSCIAETCARLRAGFARRGLVLDEAACVALAAADALLRHPLLNSYWDGERLVVRRRVHLAIMPPGGPPRIVQDAQDRSLLGIVRSLGRWPAGDPDTNGLDDRTFTIVHFGQALWQGAPIQGRQSATLGLGATQMRPAVVGGGSAERIAVRPIALLVLAYDARALDQRQADAFLGDLKGRLERFAA